MPKKHDPTVDRLVQMMAVHGPRTGGALKVFRTTVGADDDDQPQVGTRQTARPTNPDDLGERDYFARRGQGGTIGRAADDNLPIPEDIRPMPLK